VIVLGSIFGSIVDAILGGMEHLVEACINALIIGFGAAISAVVSVLPNMPALPDLPEPMATAEAWVAWVIPVHQILLALEFVVVMWVLWQGVAIGLRWAKALGD
jgi:hypothetical protein